MEKYTPLITQEDFCCVPCALQMVLHRHGIAYPSQVELATMLNLMIPERLKEQYPFAKVTDKPFDYGVHVTNLNLQLFKPLGLPFTERYTKLRYYNMDSIIKDVSKNIKDTDVLLGIYYSDLFETKEKSRTRHVILLEDCLSDGIAQVVVPHERETFRATVSLLQLFQSAEESEDGVWVIQKGENNNDSSKRTK